MTINQISVFVENKPNALHDMTTVLAEHQIDMRALSLAEAEDFGIVRVIVDHVYNATTVLKDAGYVHSITPVLGVEIPHSPGGLNQVLGIFSEAGVNVEYMYAMLGSKAAKCAYMIFCVEDPASAAAALIAKGVKLLTQEEIEEL